MKRLGLVLLLSSLALGQGVIVAPQQVLTVLNGITVPVPNATVTVCAANVGGIPCAPALVGALFKDAALTQPLPNPFTATSNGNYQFAIGPGNYTVTNTAAGFAGYSYQLMVTCVQSSACTYTATQTFTSPVALNSGGTLAGTFSGNPILSGSSTACQINIVAYVGGNCASTWGGGDIGSQINAAYAALPTAGGTIYLLPSASAYSFSTPIVLNTNNKAAQLRCAATGNAVANIGCVMNYTPTTATAAITIDYGIVTGGLQTLTGMRDIQIINNNCGTAGGCGSSATGIQIGNTNGGVLAALFQGIKVQGFGIGYANTNPTAFGHTFQQSAFEFNTTGVSIGSLENIRFYTNLFLGNGTGITSNNGEIYAEGNSFDGQSTVAITYTNSSSAVSCTLVGNHFENNAQPNTHYLTGNANYFIFGGILENDNVGGSSDFMASVGGNTLIVEGAEIASSQTLTTGFFNISGTTRGLIRAYNQTPSGSFTICSGNPTNCTVETILPSSSVAAPWILESNLKGASTNQGVGVAGTGVTTGFTPIGQLHVKGNTNTLDDLVLEDTNNPRQIAIGPGTGGGSLIGIRDVTGSRNLATFSWTSPFPVQLPNGVMDMTEVAAPSGVASVDRCYADSTAHAVKCNYNNGTNPHALRTTEVGTCTMAAGTCTLTWAAAFNATPLCVVTWNGTGALTGFVKAVPSTTNCVITSSVNTDTAVMQVVGTANPN